MMILEMDWILFWTAMSGIGGLAAVFTIVIAILNRQKKKKNTLMHTCNELCDAMSISKINTLLNNLNTICDKGMNDASAIIEIQNNLQQTVQEVKAKWKEMQLLLKPIRFRTILAKMDTIVENYRYCMRDVETIVAALGCASVDEIGKHLSNVNSQEMRDIISNTSKLYDKVPNFVKQIISLRFKDLKIPNYTTEIYALFNNQFVDESLFSIRLHALIGNAIAQNVLGDYYGKQKQFKKAFGWYKKSAEQGLAKAQYNLGLCYAQGRGVDKDEKEASRWYKEAAVQGLTEAQYNLGVCYAQGRGVDKDEKEAFRWFMKSAEQGDVEARFNLGLFYENGIGVNKDEKEAFRWYKEAAEQGDAEAQYNLGLCYAQGRGVDKDEKEAFGWYKKSAEQGLAEAQNNLGLCYKLGRGVDKDEKEAFRWYKEAAIQDYAKAQYNLGLCYAQGRGVDKDEKEAFEWFMKSAEQGDAEAQYNLGVYFENGIGCTQDFNQAFGWYTKASENKENMEVYPRAMYSIGYMYLKGTIGFGSSITAVQFFQIAAQNGLSLAQYVLGFCYENGIGMEEVDIEKAKYWYKKAANQGDENAIERLKRMEGL